MMGGFGYGMGLFGGFGMLLGTLFWVGLLALVVWGVISLARPRPTEPRVEDSALEIVKRRYARGEISQAEYEQARRDLT